MQVYSLLQFTTGCVNSVHPEPQVLHIRYPIVTSKDPKFPGVHFMGSPQIKTVTSEGVKISWQDVGVAFDIPPGAVPEDKGPLELTVRPCLTGPFQPPDGYKFTSPVYVISPAFNFTKDIQLEIHHFASLQNNEDCAHMSFISAPCCPQYSESQLQYRFKLLKGGVFKAGKPFGTINLQHFCLAATASKGTGVSSQCSNHQMQSYLLPDPDVTFDYSARLYRDSFPPGPCSCAIFCMTLKQTLYFKVII